MMSIDEFKKKITALRQEITKPTESLPAVDLFSDDLFIWAITDKNPPAKSGIAIAKTDLLEIASNHNVKEFSDPYYLNQFDEIVRWNHPLISHSKRPDGRYSVAVWGNHLQYLCNLEPVLLLENIDDEELLNVKRTHGQEHWLGADGGYIRNYIRRREARRKLGRKSKSSESESPVFVEFVYSPENTWYIPRKRWVWRRHRIVKKTAKTIFVEESPYQGSPYLITGWQAFIVYTVMIDRLELEANHYFHHHSRRKTYYTKAGAPELKNKQFIGHSRSFEYSDWFDDDYIETDNVIEIPANKHQWAMTTLGLSKWPASHEEIRRAYKIMAQKTHPDKTGGDHRPMASVNAALSFLLGNIKSR